ncbi:hypothetical protein AB833_08620 [Chromatiales bacterium (ex Bugula neritina AB1)]|nr:hypothetical protein AB833_08620 [Chromatiales bacterium (ex Bugula neritina AB1)]
MTLWQENEGSTAAPAAAMTDVVFSIECKQLPVDHAADLSAALINFLSNRLSIARTDLAVHPIHLAGSQNGWERPSANSNEALMLSRRTRLKIRVNKNTAADLITSLRETRHTIAGHPLTIVSGKLRPIFASSTLYSRYTVFDTSASATDNEAHFTSAIVNACAALGYKPTKLLCGRVNQIKSPDGPVTTRSVLLAEVPPNLSLVLQDTGLGELRSMGCGILIPHKDTGAV